MSYFLENEEVNEAVEEVKAQDGIASIEPLLDNRIVRAIREMGFEKLSPSRSRRFLIYYRVRTSSDRPRPVPVRPRPSEFRPFSTTIPM